MDISLHSWKSHISVLPLARLLKIQLLASGDKASHYYSLTLCRWLKLQKVLCSFVHFKVATYPIMLKMGLVEKYPSTFSRRKDKGNALISEPTNVFCFVAS